METKNGDKNGAVHVFGIAQLKKRRKTKRERKSFLSIDEMQKPKK